VSCSPETRRFLRSLLAGAYCPVGKSKSQKTFQQAHKRNFSGFFGGLHNNEILTVCRATRVAVVVVAVVVVGGGGGGGGGARSSSKIRPMVCCVQFEKVTKLSKDFEPFRQLWLTTSDWMRWYEGWMNDPLVEVDAEKVDKNVTESYKTIHKCCKVFAGIPGKRCCSSSSGGGTGSTTNCS